MSCVMCGEFCPEGRMVCWSCEHDIHSERYDTSGEELLQYTSGLGTNKLNYSDEG